MSYGIFNKIGDGTAGWRFLVNGTIIIFHIDHDVYKNGKINNFVTSFEYINENKSTGNSFLSNETTFNIDNNISIGFNTRSNKETNLTEYYNLIYQYKNDCLVAAVEYNKDYYSDRTLKADESIFFKLTIIPFGETSSPNLRK